MKIVEKLNKKKHRRDLWVDSGGAVWFFDWEIQDWRVIEQVPESWCEASGFTKAALGYTVDETVDIKGWPDAPFRRILKGERA